MNEKYPIKPEKIKWLRIELTNICNFDCSYCSEQFMERKKGFMDIELVKKIIDEASETNIADIIGLQFMGEGLLYPKFEEVVSYAKMKAVKLKLVTNGSLLTNKNIDIILDNGVEDVYISYFTPDEYSYNIRAAKGINHEEYQKRIKNMLLEKIKRKAGTEISVGFLNTRYCPLPGINSINTNEQARREIKTFIKFVEDTEKQSGIIPLPHDPEYINKCPDFFDNWTYQISEGIAIAFIEVAMWANQFLLKKGVKIKPAKEGFCANPFEQLFVCWDGKVSCCCLDYDCRMDMGDANKDSIANIWENDRYRYLRDSMNKGQLVDPYCQICRGKINIISFLLRADYGKLPRMIFSRGKLNYILKKGLKRFGL